MGYAIVATRFKYIVGIITSKNTGQHSLGMYNMTSTVKCARTVLVLL